MQSAFTGPMASPLLARTKRPQFFPPPASAPSSAPATHTPQTELLAQNTTKKWKNAVMPSCSVTLAPRQFPRRPRDVGQDGILRADWQSAPPASGGSLAAFLTKRTQFCLPRLPAQSLFRAKIGEKS